MHKFNIKQVILLIINFIMHYQRGDFVSKLKKHQQPVSSVKKRSVILIDSLGNAQTLQKFLLTITEDRKMTGNYNLVPSCILRRHFNSLSHLFESCFLNFKSCILCDVLRFKKLSYNYYGNFFKKCVTLGNCKMNCTQVMSDESRFLVVNVNIMFKQQFR